MKALVKVGTNSVTSVLESKHVLTPAEAVIQYKQLLQDRGIAKTAAEAEAYFQRKQIAQWQDGDIVTLQPDDWNWGTLELKQFLIITVPDGIDLTGPRERITNPGTENEERELLGPAKYRYPYWNHLTDKDLVDVRDRNSDHQPLIDTLIKITDMVKL